MRWVAVWVLALGCGRVAFDAQSDARAAADVLSDTPVTLGPELIVNGDFSAGLTNWTTTVVSTGTFGAPYPNMAAWSSPLSSAAFIIDAPGDADGYAEQTVTAAAGGRLQLQLLTWGGADPITVKLSADRRS